MSSPLSRRRTISVAVIALALGAVWLGCGRDAGELMAPTDAALSQRLAIQTAIAVQDRHTPELMKIPGVVGTATGLGADGQPVVRVFTETPGLAELPARLDGLPVEVKVIGLVMARTDPTDRFPRPVPTGVSTGHPNITAGTIGARVRDALGNVYALSNNHVYADQNRAYLGDPVLQPGPFDDGQYPGDEFGVLDSYVPIDFSFSGYNLMDAAIALSSTAELGNSTPADGYGIPNSTIYGDANGDGYFDSTAELLGLPVQKYGRTTLLTQGTVTEVNVFVEVCYEAIFNFCIKSAYMYDQLGISPGTFSGGGDSGSLIVSQDGLSSPVGLLFAGGSDRTFANRIDLVLKEFGVFIDGSAPTPIVDVAVTSVDAPSSVEQGETVDVNVTVRNVGTEEVGGFDVTLTDLTAGSPGLTQAIVGLTAGADTTLTYQWDATDESLGDHVLEARHALTGDENPSNDAATTTVTVDEPTVPTPAPTVLSCNPESGSRKQKLTVSIFGADFQDGASVSFGAGIAVRGVTFVGPDQLDANLRIGPRAARGPRDVTVTNPDGQSGTATACFTVN
ncbi:MAG: hypothetical protein JSV86_14545 [Gemmatimonadota bacterium]|nr:MAG: hypothetical protein JSV86_14545 [Gemmatimonadota bacterium]